MADGGGAAPAGPPPSSVLTSNGDEVVDLASELLTLLLRQAAAGRIQIPEFQRELVGSDDWTASLLASVSLEYPIGAVTLLRSGPATRLIGVRSVSGAVGSGDPDWLLVDGQRRLTSLYRNLTPAGLGLFYIDVDRVLDGETERDDAIIVATGAPDPGWFPLSLTLGATDARGRWLARRGGAAARRFEREVLTAFDRYEVPVIRLSSEMTRWTVRVHGGPHGRELSDRLSPRE